MAAEALGSPPASARVGGGDTGIVEDPNFAVVCAFIERFGALCGVQCPNIGDLQDMIESSEVKQEWILFQVKLLRKLKKSVSLDKWERALSKFAYSYSQTDGWELERFGYKHVKPTVKLRILKNLIESQFDVNPKFKQEINQKPAKELRMEPLGFDKLGNAYWYHLDGEANLRVYKEDPDEETWEIVAQNRDQFLALIEQLKTGSTFVKPTTEDKKDNEVEEEDSMQGYENVLRDTGPVPISEAPSNVTSVTPSANNSDDEDNDDDDHAGEDKNVKSDEKATIKVENLPPPESAPKEESKDASSEQNPKPGEREKKDQDPCKAIAADVKSENPVSDSAKENNDHPREDSKSEALASMTNKDDKDAPSEPTPDETKKEQPEKAKPAYSIESLISSDTSKKRTLSESNADEEQTGKGQSDAKKPKEDLGEAITEKPLIVQGPGSGADNQVGNFIIGDVIRDPPRYFQGQGSGADCLARNSRVTNGNGVSEAEEESKESNTENSSTSKAASLKVKDGPEEKNGKSVNTSKNKKTQSGSEEEEEAGDDDTCETDQDNGDGDEDEEEESPKKSKPSRSKGRNKDDNDSDDNDEDDDDDENESSSKGKSKKSKKFEDPSDDDERTARRLSRRTSGRIAALRIREAERRQREEEEALEEYKEKQKKKDEREKKRMEKYRKLGLDYEREMARKRAKKLKRKQRQMEEDEDYSGGDDDGGEKKRRRRRKKKKKKRGEENLKEFERFSSGSSSGDEGLEGEEFDEQLDELHAYDEDDDDLFRSDHEFSCESDVPDGEVLPVKHARTATKRKRAKSKKAKIQEEAEEATEEEDDDEEEEEDEHFACKKCEKADQPEWILLCDKCDAGWHASCLRPTLMVIPEGDWFCPECQHLELLAKLEENFQTFDVLLKKKDADVKRKERLAFVSLSLSNIMPANSRKSEKRSRPKKRSRSSSEGSYSESDSEYSSSSSDTSEDDQALGSRRRAARNVTYTMKEYDDMIKSAIADEEAEVMGAGNAGYGKNIDNIIGANQEEEEEEEDKDADDKQSGYGKGKDMSTILGAEEDEDEDTGPKMETVGDEIDAEVEEGGPKPLKMVIEKGVGKKRGKSKKKKRLNALTDSESGDGDSGSDFVASEGSVVEEDEDFELEDELDEDSDDYGGGRRKKSYGAPTRRSSRSRKVIYDDDFVIDGSGSEEEQPPDDSWNSDDSDSEDYGRRKKKKKKPTSIGGKKKGGKKKARRRKRSETDEESIDEDFDLQMSAKKRKQLAESAAGRSTRGKKIDFIESENSESDEAERQQKAAAAARKKKKLAETSEEEFDEADLCVDESDKDSDEYAEDD